MRYSFISPQSNFIVFSRHKFPLTLYFNRVLACFEIFRDSVFSYDDKISLALALVTPHSFLIRDVHKKVDLLNSIFADFVAVQKNNHSCDAPLFDFFEDYFYIFSAFLSDYNINLNDMHDKLLWHDFLALFMGLSKTSKIMEIIAVRSAPVPVPNRYNSEYIASLRQLKDYYALNSYSSKSGNAMSSNSFKAFADELRANAYSKNNERL